MRDLVDIMTSLPGLEVVDLGGLRALWLPADVAIADQDLASKVHPVEWERASKLKVPLRRSEFLRSRYLIRFATGYTEPLVPKPEGDPSWPPGIVGSLTHKSGAVGLLLAPESRYLSVGFDAEELAKVRPFIAGKILSEAEAELLASLGDERALALVFSFKESIFKCHFPLGRRMFYFHDAEVSSIEPAQGTIRARLLSDTSPRTPTGYEVEGHFVYKDGFVLTATSEGNGVRQAGNGVRHVKKSQ